MNYQLLTLALVSFPLIGALVAGLGGKAISHRFAHSVTTLSVALSFLLSLYFAYQFFFLHSAPYDANLYLWDLTAKFRFNIGFLVDPLSVTLFLIVTFVSLIVHLYSIGYMAGDPGYKRFFSYVSAFTFAMLMLVSANNFLQLFFGWEAVGLVSYLLIGFWFKRPSANAGSLKAFLVNRVGDFGFLLGIALLFSYFGSLDYLQVFHLAPQFQDITVRVLPNFNCALITLICFLLFIGAMGKSAQIPLHVWLPESMEGPTPISALIHAATMVTAGVYLVARLSPLYQSSPAILNIILILGATTALFMGLVAIVQTDIKRVIAYSTLSQLGYMMVALGASAYTAGIFHLVTHAFFKALLFLAAGAIILSLHHQQDIRKMGGLWKRLPFTYLCFLIGALALAAIPPFSGFYSKEAIIDAVHESTLPAAHYAYYCVLIGAFVTALYIFRVFFVVFHGQLPKELHVEKSPRVIQIALLALTIPSLIAGYLLVDVFLKKTGLLSTSVVSVTQHAAHITPGHSSLATTLSEHAATLLALLGIGVAWLVYLRFPTWPQRIKTRYSWIYRILIHKYGFDELNNWLFVRGSQRLARWFFKLDSRFLDNYLVDGSARRINWISQSLRRLQSGYLSHYAWIMLLGVLIFLITFLL